MERSSFESLLYEEESTTLDFKRDQYPFVKATEEQKSELLKDILGFANAWRRSDAYILIGVEEVRGGRSNVVGIARADHLPDHSLQQFVTNLTNHPVRFHYEAFDFEGKQVGIIRIEQQPRPPFLLKRDYGKLKKGEVYVRRGSSTAPSKPASAEEIARMGQTTEPPSAELVVRFADPDSDSTLGREIYWDAEFCEMPPSDDIPDFKESRQSNPVFGIDLSTTFADPRNRPNPNYFRELAEYSFSRRLSRPLRLVVQNVGVVAAKNVRCELETPAGSGVHVMYASDLPDAPKRRCSILDSAAIHNFQSQLRRTPGDVTIDRNDERYMIEMECGDLQPGRRLLSDVFYARKSESGELELTGHIYADNLSQPKEFTLAIFTKVIKTSLTVNELRELSKPST